MDKAQIRKLKSYILGGLTFGAAYDSIVPIIKNHFLRSLDKRIDIPRKYEYALISRVLQGRSWDRVSRSLGMDKVDVMNRFRELIGRMRLKYIEEDKV
jgi:tRNA(Met) C34 N-acetyltransferase TmcA